MVTLFMFTREQVEGLRVGDFAPDPFGRLREVKSVDFRGNDVNGKAYVGYSVEFGLHSTITNSIKEGKLLRTVALSRELNSAEIDQLEASMKEAV